MECSAMSCNHFECGGIGHHKNCVRYPESMQNMIDDKNERIKELELQVEFKIKECQELASACDRHQTQLSKQKVNTLTNLRDAIQPGGWINSDAGVETIKSITKSINVIIEQERK